ncbi:MAG: hypothetical protein ABFC63_12305 [Thermoguttaceae bacterium]
MSIGPTGIGLNVAGVPLAQTAGATTERTQQAVAARSRRVHHDQTAEAAAGVGQPDGDHHQPGERDADGRRPWEEPPDELVNNGAPPPRQSKDSLRQSGHLLDLTG